MVIRLQSLSARRAWIEIGIYLYYIRYPMSLSARRAWIEIHFSLIKINITVVALRKESVDRNIGMDSNPLKLKVALRKESVDRNSGT